jgi:hypothetical protein
MAAFFAVFEVDARGVGDGADALAVVRLDVGDDLGRGFLEVGGARAPGAARAADDVGRPTAADGRGAVRQHALERLQRGLADELVELGDELADAVLDLGFDGVRHGEFRGGGCRESEPASNDQYGQRGQIINRRRAF